MTQIRSYRRVFDLERRIYSVDRMRLNPSGVPLRGVVYLLGLVACVMFAGRLPVLGVVVEALPWFVRDILVPVALAAALTLIRVDGRAFHHAARSIAVFLVSPRTTVALGGRSPVGDRWSPHELLVLPDGSDPGVRRFRYKGPGAVLVLVAHHSESRGGYASPKRRLRSSSRLCAEPGARRLGRGRVLGVDAGASLLVDVSRRGEPR